MRCPNCGAFVEDNKTVCTMCGTPINKDNNQNMGFNTFNNGGGNPFGNTGGFNSNNSNSFNNMNNMNNINGMNAFGSGNMTGSYNTNQPFNGNPNANPSFSTGSSFSNGNINQNISKRTEEYERKFNSYQDQDYKTNIKKEDKDIFDFFSENKTIIKVVSLLVLVAILSFAGFKYYQYRSKDKPIEPTLLNLYFEVDSSLQQVAGNSNSSVVFNKSGEKGSACSISITYGSSTSSDHVHEFFTNKKKEIEPERDTSANVVDELKIFTPSESNMNINDENWYYLNVFYKLAKDADPTFLKYKYLTATYKGYYYDIELVNNSNDAACNASLDNFAKSLKFVDAEKKK